MSLAQAYSKLSSVAQSVTIQGLTDTLTPVVQYALQNKQVQLQSLKELRIMTDKGVKPVQMAMGKTMPVVWDKESQSYTFSNEKRDALVTELGLTVVTVKGQKLTDEEKLANEKLVKAWIFSKLSPKADHEDTKAEKQVKAWTEAQSKAQAERLQSMDLDQIDLQIKALKALLSQADSVRSSKLASVKLAA